MKLKKVIIHKYKSFESDQEFELNDNISILVGMNESGKTSALEAIAKTNYFQNDEQFKFNFTHDYPRKEKKKVEKSGEKPNAVTCTYQIPDWLMEAISEDIGKDVFTNKEFSITTKYKSSDRTFNGISVDKKKFIEYKTKKLNITSASLSKFK